ncbi:MAG: signal recognition particle protein [Candidatus Aenigmarchaeota archaeon]|nr:signal recognition particle protein [Candidatus Aenigmarchaeota archaeon]
MVLEKLGSGLKDTFRKIAGLGVVDKEAVERIVRDLQRTLIQADVDVKVVFELSQNIKNKVLKEKPPKGITLKEYFIKTLYDEIVELLGKESGKLSLKKQKILLIGLFGCGKTTTCGKLALWFKKRGLSAGLVACDTHRAAAQDQLRQIGKKLDVPVYFEGKKPEDIAKNALKKAKENVLIFDSAGRDALDGKLAKELKNLGKIIKPDEVFLVIPADIGQAARKQSEEFNKMVGITGLIVTKLDGTAKGGGALSASSVSGSNVRMIGVGEKLENFEEYDPQRFVSRLIGYGDIQGLLEKAKEAGAEDTAKKMMEGRFTMNEFYEQLGSLQKMGSLSSLTSMIPGFSGAMAKKMPKDFLDVQEDKMKRWKFIIDSMTPKEREDPDVIKVSRVQRIAKGSGTTQAEVRELIKNYKQIKKVLKMTGGGKAFKRGPLAKLAKQLGMGM